MSNENEVLVLFENRVILGDCLQVLQFLPDNCIDCIVTDPPYGLGTREPTAEDIVRYLLGERLDTGGDFMGKEWEIPPVAVWKECLRVLKPGGHLFSFGGTRTWDLISLGLRAAGFQLRDTIKEDHPAFAWVQGQGMPKSHNIWKGIDKSLGVKPVKGKKAHDRTPETEEAAEWDGWGTALKPTWEPILVFKKPIVGTIAKNVLKYGTGGLNIEATRVKHASKEDFEKHKMMVDRLKEKGGSLGDSWKNSSDLSGANEVKTSGRWPPNSLLVHTPSCKKIGTKTVKGSGTSKSFHEAYEGESDTGLLRGWSHPGNQHADEDGNETVESWDCTEGCPVAAMDALTGNRPGMPKTTRRKGDTQKGYGGELGPDDASATPGYGDAGGASRFFPQFEGQYPPEVPYHYSGKASKREASLDGLVPNKHPTKKPVALIQWLIRLGTPKGGIVLDPYVGSGTTCVAAVEEEVRFIGIEMDENYYPDTSKRVDIVVGRAEEDQAQRDLFDEIMGS